MAETENQLTPELIKIVEDISERKAQEVFDQNWSAVEQAITIFTTTMTASFRDSVTRVTQEFVVPPKNVPGTASPILLQHQKSTAIEPFLGTKVIPVQNEVYVNKLQTKDIAKEQLPTSLTMSFYEFTDIHEYAQKVNPSITSISRLVVKAVIVDTDGHVEAEKIPVIAQVEPFVIYDKEYGTLEGPFFFEYPIVNNPEDIKCKIKIISYTDNRTASPKVLANGYLTAVSNDKRVNYRIDNYVVEVVME